MTERLINTNCGAIRGKAEDGILSFLGVRYATAQRFEYPKLVEHWDGIYDAFTYGKCAYQPRAFQDESKIPKKKFYYHEFREQECYTYSEDCLFLNLWVPEHAHNAPVIFYVHGGSFISGCGHEKPFKSPVWAKQGVIAVTINYRLGPLGFACFPELKAKDGHTGNYALYDQLAALQWIYQNIAAFGGDPKNITVMGQSAGAMCLQQLSMSPKTYGMIARAVLCSGGGIGKLFGTNKQAEECYPYWQDVMKETGVHNVFELKALPVQQLFHAWNTVNHRRRDGLKTLYPCIDDTLITMSANTRAKNGSYIQIPYLLCSTGNDLLPPILHIMAKRWLSKLAETHAPGYLCFFDRSLPGDVKGAWHSSDLWYWFGTLANGWRPFTTQDYELSNRMVHYLCNFCLQDNPNDDSLPVWEPFTQKQNHAMIFDDEGVHMGNVSVLKLIKNMIFHN